MSPRCHGTPSKRRSILPNVLLWRIPYTSLPLPNAKCVHYLHRLRTASGAIRALADDARPHGVRKLEGADDLYRLRVGDYRIIYRISDGLQRVTVVRIRHRGDVYRAE